MSKCRKCGNPIPSRITMEGKVRNLANRKFCLVCSPWGKHNTKVDVDSISCNKKSTPYAQWPEKYKRSLQKSNYKRGQQRKEKLVEMAGGKCIICGYKKTIKVLEFHHRIPAEKLFGMNIATLSTKNWEVILLEFAKCDLLCRNCHGETHDIDSFPESIRNEVEADRQKALIPKVLVKRECLECHDPFIVPDWNKEQVFCSSVCSHKALRRVERPSLEVLAEEIKNSSWVSLGKKYGVSDNAVKKWAISYGIIFPKTKKEL